MELLSVDKSIEEEIPLITAGCMALKGLSIHPQVIDSLLRDNNFSDLVLDNVLDISNYASAIGFIGVCNQHKFKMLTGSIVFALANFLLKRVVNKEGFFAEDIEINQLCLKLDEMFAKQKQAKNLALFIKEVYFELNEMKMLATDNEAFIYLIVNFYLFTCKNSVLIYPAPSNDIQSNFSDLTDWVLNWEG